MTLSDDLKQVIELLTDEIVSEMFPNGTEDETVRPGVKRAIESRLGPLLDLGSRYLVPEKWNEYKAALQRAKKVRNRETLCSAHHRHLCPECFPAAPAPSEPR